MNFQSKKLVFETARPEDGKEILEILEENDFKGKISLVYTRRPDAYTSFAKEGEEVSIVVCRDKEKGKIAGIGALAFRRQLINGEEETVGYLFGLRVRKEYRKSAPIIPKGYQMLYESVAAKGVRLIYTTILEENIEAQKLLEKKRVSIPYYEFYTKYHVYSFKTGLKWRTTPDKGFVFREADGNDIAGIVEFLNREGAKHQLYPKVNENLLRGEELPGVSYEDFYVLYGEKGQIEACGAVWNQEGYKQYLIKAYGGVLKYAYPFSGVCKLFGYPSLPKPGSFLDFFTLSFWAVKDTRPEVFRAFLNGISKTMGNYRFFTVGICQSHPLKEVMEEVPHLKYASKVYFVDWSKAQSIVGQLETGKVPYIECGML